jgi:hypothetical protein
MPAKTKTGFQPFKLAETRDWLLHYTEAKFLPGILTAGIKPNMVEWRDTSVWYLDSRFDPNVDTRHIVPESQVSTPAKQPFDRRGDMIRDFFKRLTPTRFHLMPNVMLILHPDVSRRVQPAGEVPLERRLDTTVNPREILGVAMHSKLYRIPFKIEADMTDGSYMNAQLSGYLNEWLKLLKPSRRTAKLNAFIRQHQDLEYASLASKQECNDLVTELVRGHLKQLGIRKQYGKLTFGEYVEHVCRKHGVPLYDQRNRVVWAPKRFVRR